MKLDYWTAPTARLSDKTAMDNPLPFWPRYLTREQAALYVGVSVDVFDDEVREGTWPPARLRGKKGGRLTWDRVLLDRFADLSSGIQYTQAQAGTAPPDADIGEDLWMRRINGQTTKAGA